VSASVACGLIGTLLAQVDDEEENLLVLDLADAAALFGGSEPVYLGGSDFAEEGVWRWADLSVYWDGGAPTSLYANWATPPTADDLDCMGLESDGTWVEVGCDVPRAFVCEGF